MTGIHDLSRAYSEAYSCVSKNLIPASESLEISRTAARKFSEIAFMAARRNAELSSEWAEATLQNFGTAAKVRKTGSEYATAAIELFSASSESFAKLLGAYGDLTVSVQSEAFQIFMNANAAVDQRPLAPVQQSADCSPKIPEMDVAAVAKDAIMDAEIVEE